jgi:NAD-dependent deacetylase
LSSDASITKAVDLISRSRHLVALTGAGISTASGIPDFRSPDSGLWSKINPYLVASVHGFRLRPKSFYKWLRPLAVKVRDARPNPAHFALVRLEEMGLLKTVITQNVDGLHQAAGSRRVLELHGDARRMTCMKCGKVLPSEPFIDRYVVAGTIPRCPGCRGVLKPNVVLFGELYPVRVLLEAAAEADVCDVMLVAGSSLLVVPACEIPVSARESGAEIIIINFQPTPLDSAASVVIHEDVAELLPRVVEAVAERLSQSEHA